MGYVTQSEYMGMYGEIETAEFNRLSFKANRILAENTTGVDGFEKLRQAMPTDEDTLTSLKYCAAELVHTLRQIETLERAGAVVARSDGTMAPAMVSSVSSGAESITYSTNGVNTVVSAAAGSLTRRADMFHGIVKNYLSGMKDANGVNLLYMGVYPNV